VEDNVSQSSLKVRPSAASRTPHQVRILPLFVVPLALALPLGLCSAGRTGEPVARATFGDVKGTLVIVGGGTTPDDVHQRFLDLAGGVNAHLVIIPTAHLKADHFQSLKSFAFWHSTKVQSVYFLHTSSRALANDPTFVRPLTQATGVWFCGGDQSRILDAYHGTAVERELHNVLTRGGVIGGTSAGAAIMSSVMITGGITEASVGTGFGFLPGFIVDQHFKQRNRFGRLTGVLRKYPQLFGLGIDERTAVIVHGHSLTVMGQSNARLYFPGGPSREQLLDRTSKPLDLAVLTRTLTAQAQAPTQIVPVSHEPAPRMPSATAFSHNMGMR
jgi:cyanophycinase